MESQSTPLASSPMARPAHGGRKGELAGGQLEIWMADRLSNHAALNINVVTVQIDPSLDDGTVARALAAVARRQSCLRAVFREEDGLPFQEILEDPPLDFSILDSSGWSHADYLDWYGRATSVPFDLARSVCRFHLLKDCPVADGAARANLFVSQIHHIVTDFASVSIALAEFNRCLAQDPGASPAPEELPSILDFARAERALLEGPEADGMLAYWSAKLCDLTPSQDLPLDRLPGGESGRRSGRIQASVPTALAQQLRSVGKELSATPFTLVLAAWSAFLYRHSHSGDIRVGAPFLVKGREFRDVMGNFVNLLPMRLRLNGGEPFEEVVEQANATILEARRVARMPLGHVLQRLGLGQTLAGGTLFQTTLAWESSRRMPRAAGSGSPLRLDTVSGHMVGANQPLAVSFHDDGRDLAMLWHYDAALFQPATIERMVARFITLLQGAAAEPGCAIDTLPLLPEAERRLVVETWNATRRPYPRDRCVHELFESQAARTPEATAVRFEGQSLTYGRLNARANRLAHHLRALGVKPEARVAICAPRGTELVVGLLAVLKAGGAYVPLDAAYPPERLAFMLADCAPTALLTLGDAGRGLDGAVPRVDLAQEFKDLPETNPDPGAVGLRASNLAYVIYTSGSTGQPKGAMNEHRAVVNRLLWMQEAYRLGGDDAVLQKTPFSFDVSVWEFFWPLLAGSRLVLARPEGHKDPVYLADLINREGITTLHFVPSMLQVFLDEAPAATCTPVRRVMCSGEALPAALVRRFQERFPRIELHNLYGPTEAAVDVTAWACEPGAHATAVPIGRPIANTQMYVLDAHGQPVPVGVAGELHIGGVQVGRGYLNRLALTAERFLPNPFAKGQLYKTGDLGRWLPDGSLEYLGRNDFQVKIRGFRIELGEIEARLQEHPDLREAVVLAREDAGNMRLIAYVTPGSAPGAAVLRDHLAATLPDHMIPAAFVHLETLPLTPNGKLDRGALPAPGGDAFAARGYEAPEGEVETALAAVWKDLLKVDRIGRNDNFFDLGGHSLLVLRAQGRLARMGLAASAMDLYAHPTLAALASHLAAGRRPVREPVPLRTGGQGRPLFLVHDGAGSHAYAHRLANHLAPGFPVLALAFDLDEAGPEPTLAGLAADMARAVRAVQPEGPYRLAGHSLGGVLAQALAAHLTAEGQPIEFLGLLDAFTPAALRALHPGPIGETDLILDYLERLPGLDSQAAARFQAFATGEPASLEVLVAHGRSLGLIPAEVQLEQIRLVLEATRTLHRAASLHEPPQLDAPAHLFLAEDGGRLPADHGWSRALPGLRPVPVPGGHHTMVQEPRVAALGRALSEALEGPAAP